MPTRYFQPPLGPELLLQLLAGYGAGQRETAIADAQLRSEENRLRGAGIGKMVANAFNVPTTFALQRLQGEEEMRQRSALAEQEFDQRSRLQQQAARDAMAIEQLRNSGDIYQQAASGFQRTYGVPHTAILQRAREGQAPGGALPALEAGLQPLEGPPAPGQIMPDSGVPLAIADPRRTQEYRIAKRESDMWRSVRAVEEVRPMVATDHPLYAQAVDERRRTLEAIDQGIARTKRILDRYQEPQPPRTEDEMKAAGVHGGGITEFSDGSRLIPEGTKIAMPQKDPRLETMPWLAVSDPVAAEQMQANDFKARTRIEPDANGKPTMFLKQKSGEWEPMKMAGRGGDDSGDLSFEDAVKLSTQITDSEGKAATLPQVLDLHASYKKEIAKRKAQERAAQIEAEVLEPERQALVQELAQYVAGSETQSYPIAVLVELGRRLKEAFKGELPEPVDNAIEQLLGRAKEAEAFESQGTTEADVELARVQAELAKIVSEDETEAAALKAKREAARAEREKRYQAVMAQQEINRRRGVPARVGPSFNR